MMVKKLEELTPGELEKIVKRTNIQNVNDSVLPILDDVKEHGDSAVKAYTKKFDRIDLTEITVTTEEINKAIETIDPRLFKHLEMAASNIKKFHEKQKIGDWYTEIGDGITLGQKITPLERIGAYIPGGRAAYPSTALMTIIPARVAGVNEVIVCTPPGPDKSIHPATLAACHIAGSDQVFKVGGVQAVAAMAYGTDTIPKVDKIVGPGNAHVTAAKTLVRGECEIDFPAGPSEILVIADNMAEPSHVAWDMLAQCEHDPAATSILITTSNVLAAEVQRIIAEEIKTCERQEIITQSIQNAAIITVPTIEECIEFSNNFSPEHLEIITKNPQTLLEKIKNAGSIFIGNYAPISAGDYASGTNHVLPTAGYARIYSGLNIDHFTKKTTIQVINKKGLATLKDTITTIAEAEGLYAHAKAVQARF
ncbi:histidinol dehydrogenase [Methanosarcinales archaeon]|nr:MAG: histidinol dehydrogenase [Methanosarcinales archaeon]